MNIFPAIDLYEKKAVRLYKGDYARMTVYSDDPASLGKAFADAGASFVHIVDLEGAKDGTTPNLDTVLAIKRASGLFCEVGGGVRSMEVIDRYLSSGIDRVILGTAAVTNEEFLVEAVRKYGERIAVGIDLSDGCVAIKGWTEKTEITADTFFSRMQSIGVGTIICTDISRDGAMMGTNRALYRALGEKYSMNIIASGGVSSISDVEALAEMKLYGAIIGKAYYTGDIDLRKAIEVAQK
ncbi:MAG: 1-(5-phosphoribosyl)-5-[(5-phosphoribosylamino)methylideneamino]imidazole-4-carboxamide isomerase [Ruminococcaceae bacterium]|nr:1-(5-phosphoribosyl)-5-[(5-phosphoribosylamino)methylideneamino]imidazole-4-carboxamide isomerase [Oscillospiraceae bacterium]